MNFDSDILSKSVWVPDINVEIPRRNGGAIDPLGITYYGPILAGLATPTRIWRRANHVAELSPRMDVNRHQSPVVTRFFRGR
jgi:hypothetical protein